jgi:hypothetical protein
MCFFFLSFSFFLFAVDPEAGGCVVLELREAAEAKGW